MDFITLNEISKQFDLPERVARYRFNNLCQANKLVEPDDFVKEDVIDDKHFTYKINPLSFIRETKLEPVPRPEQVVGNQTDEVVNKVDTNGIPNGNQVVNKEPEVVNQTDTKEKENDLVKVLMEQLKVKDEQIQNYTEELKTTKNINERLIGQTIRYGDKIQQLLLLSSGNSEVDNKEEILVTKEQGSDTKDDKVGYQED